MSPSVNLCRPPNRELNFPRSALYIIEGMPLEGTIIKHVVHASCGALAWTKMKLGGCCGKGKLGPEESKAQSSGKTPKEIAPDETALKGRCRGANHDRESAGPNWSRQFSHVYESGGAIGRMMHAPKRCAHAGESIDDVSTTVRVQLYTAPSFPYQAGSRGIRNGWAGSDFP